MSTLTDGWVFPEVSLLNFQQSRFALHDVNGAWRWEQLPKPIISVNSLSMVAPNEGFGVVYTFTSVGQLSGQTYTQGQLVYYHNGAWNLETV
jgi:hypothetical protein